MRITTLRSIPTLVIAAALVACGGTDTGMRNTPNAPPPVDNTDTGVVYSGPAIKPEAQAFAEHLWPLLTTTEVCGSCHGRDGLAPESLWFAQREIMNEAYDAVLPLVDMERPQLSLLVTHVAAGHNPWGGLTPSQAGDTILTALNRWITAGGGSTNSIVLEPPPVLDAANTLQFTDTVTAAATYASTIGALVRDPLAANCVSCHAEDAPSRQQPFFASSNDDSAFFAARTLIDLSVPGNSRFIQRMRENHNVWQDPSGAMTPTAYSVQRMTEEINRFINGDGSVQSGAVAVAVDDRLVVSNFINIPNGVVASSGGRWEQDVIALYQFKSGSGSVAADTSGVQPLAPLNLSPEIEWVGSWGIRIEDNGIATASTANSKKIHDLIRLTGEFSIEAWVVPANVTQEDARIVTYSAGQNLRNFTLNQNIYNYDFLTRTDALGDPNGMPRLNTPSADEVLQATLQHVVTTFDPIEGRRIYVNGVLEAQDSGAGSINDWDDSYVLAVGNEIGSTDWWEGTIRLLAIHNRALTPDQITGNFEVGVGQKYYLLFGVSDLVGMDEAYIVFTVEVYDDYSYLFSSPFFISLDRDAVFTDPISINGIRIGINGKEAAVGQAFANVSAEINATNYNAETGVALATNPAGTLISLENGPLDDLFFLSFDSVNGQAAVRDAEPTVEAPVLLAAEEQAGFGVRLFDEIFQNMSAITMVPSAEIYTFYVENIRRSLPAASSPTGFLASQQSAITQLALNYCNALMDTANGYHDAFFAAGDYGDLSSDSEIDALIDPFLNRMLINDGGGLISHPTAQEIKQTLTHVPPQGSGETPGLIQNLGSAQPSQKAVAVCTSVLASAAMLMQ